VHRPKIKVEAPQHPQKLEYWRIKSLDSSPPEKLPVNKKLALPAASGAVPLAGPATNF
jgi:hypothetical protein